MEQDYLPIDLNTPFDWNPNGGKIDFNSRSSMWIRAAAVHYFLDAYKSMFRSRFKVGNQYEAFRLPVIAIPEPSNNYDPCAVQLKVNNTAAGYIPARLSPEMYSFVRYQELNGRRCILPAVCKFDHFYDEYYYEDEDEVRELEYDVNLWICVPTLHHIQDHLDQDQINKEFKNVYETAPEDIRNVLQKDGFHLRSMQVYEHFLSKSSSMPNVPLEGPAEGPSPLAVNRALKEIRFEHEKAKYEEKLKKEYEVILKVLPLIRNGNTFAETSRITGINAQKISKYAKIYGLREGYRLPPRLVDVIKVCYSAFSVRKSRPSVTIEDSYIQAGVHKRNVDYYYEIESFLCFPERYPSRFILAKAHYTRDADLLAKLMRDEAELAAESAASIILWRTLTGGDNPFMNL